MRMRPENGSDLSQRILRAAEDLFFAKGYANTQLRAIARSAGSSESGILRLFHSKNGLIRAVYVSCWKQLNDQIDSAVAAAAAVDPDPRNLLLALARAVLQGYEENPAMFGFLISHFGIRDTNGLTASDSVDPEIDAEVRRQYHRYLDRIDQLCSAVAAGRPALAAAGVTSGVIAEMLTSVLYGIQTGWHMAELEKDPTSQRIATEDVLAALRFFLYPDQITTDDSQ